MTHWEIREKFIKFFEEKGHKLVLSSSLLPTDPSVLFTTAGMQQFKPYYTGEADPMKDFGSLNTVSIQKCLRTSDIEQVGDDSHLTFFEMLGNFSFGGYFKEEAIKWAHEFITKEMGLKIDYVAVFGGEGELPPDEESEKIWKSIDPNIVVKKAGRADNFWGPTGDKGPCGPTSEIYVDGVEIWNLVFNQYYQHKDGRLEPLKTPGVDTGMGLERLAVAVQNKKNIFETDLFESMMATIPKELAERTRRIVADHARAIVFLLADGIRPSNKDRGYILRRLIRRILAHEFLYRNNTNIFLESTLKEVIKIYSHNYRNLDEKTIMEEFAAEEGRSLKAMHNGVKELEKIKIIGADEAFKLYESYGLPYEIIKDFAGEKAAGLTREAFDEEFRKHQEKSRTASAGMFKGGLADTSAETTRLHTAAHLMLEALRRVLGEHVQQKGSNITPERLRFDFSHGEKMTPEQIQEVEDLVNEQIQKDLPVHFEEMSVDEAKKIGATGVFERKYGEKVKVYFVGGEGDYFSKEICGGPHVSHTGEVGKLHITKEEAISAGVRRIRAVIQ
jgi:alanyl-tRNA synthetase